MLHVAPGNPPFRDLHQIYLIVKYRACFSRVRESGVAEVQRVCVPASPSLHHMCALHHVHVPPRTRTPHVHQETCVARHRRGCPVGCPLFYTRVFVRGIYTER